MNVKELKQQLDQFGDDMEVHFAYNYGDHWHTTVTPVVDAVDTGFVKHSAYHDMDKEVDADLDDRSEDAREVVIIRA